MYAIDESKKILGSFDVKHYDEIITRLRLQAIEKYQYGREEQQKEKNELHIQKRKRKKRILLVDDEPDHCMIYQIVLEDAGYECVSYTDSVYALKEFKANYYDLIILDIKIPKLDGFALCEKIRELDKAVPIIFITASEEYYQNFRKQYYPKIGKDTDINCIQKPIGNQGLIQIVNMTIATKDTK